MLQPTVRHVFVEYVPSEREDGVVYVSIPYSTAVHNCLCGCGMKVVTPIRPDKWTLTYNGEAISLSPSIGNWSFRCQSHYWIRSGRVIEAGPMSQGAIEYGRVQDQALSERWHGLDQVSTVQTLPTHERTARKKRGFWAKLFGR